MERTLSPDAATAICKHMNDDHADAVASYARSFGQVPSVESAEIVALDSNAMELAVDTGADRITTRIVFDHVLQDLDDARMTLIEMAKRAVAD